MICSRLIAAAVLALAAPVALASNSEAGNEIVVGTHLDLTGPLSELGIAVRNGVVLAFDEANAAGGIRGRKLKLIALDDSYNVRKALTATKILLHRDHVLAVLCPVGTPPVARTMPLVLNGGTLHLFPFTSDDVYVPMQPLEFATDLPVAQQIAVGLRLVAAQRGELKLGVLHRSDALGRAALKGATAELARRNVAPVAVAAYEPGSGNLVAQLQALHAAGAELVVIGGVADEAITAMRQAAAQNWFPVFLCGSACYVPELPPLGGRTTSGLYATATTPIPYPDDPDKRLRGWVRRFETRFGTFASPDALRAYLDARLFVAALRRVKGDPKPYAVAQALEALSPWTDPEYGGVPLRFTVKDHRGFHTGFLAEVKNGRWVTVEAAKAR